MDTELDMVITSPDVRISGDRRMESIVPALRPSSSCEGLTSTLVASVEDQYAIAPSNFPGTHERVDVGLSDLPAESENRNIAEPVSKERPGSGRDPERETLDVFYTPGVLSEKLLINKRPSLNKENIKTKFFDNDNIDYKKDGEVGKECQNTPQVISNIKLTETFSVIPTEKAQSNKTNNNNEIKDNTTEIYKKSVILDLPSTSNVKGLLMEISNREDENNVEFVKTYKFNPKKNTKNKKRKKGSLSTSDDEDELNTSKLRYNQRIALEKETFSLETEHATEVFNKMTEWLDELDDLRARSKNLNGAFKGRMHIL